MSQARRWSPPSCTVVQNSSRPKEYKKLDSTGMFGTVENVVVIVVVDLVALFVMIRSIVPHKHSGEVCSLFSFIYSPHRSMSLFCLLLCHCL